MKKKTTLYLDDAAHQALKRLAKEKGESEAMMVREAVDVYLGVAGRPPLRSLGVAKGPRSLAADTEALLAEGFGKPRADR